MQVIKQLWVRGIDIAYDPYEKRGKYDNGNVGLFVEDYLKSPISLGDIFYYTFTYEKRGFYHYNNVYRDVLPQAQEIKNIHLKVEKIIAWKQELNFLTSCHKALIYFSGAGFEDIGENSFLSNVYPIKKPFN